MARGLRRTRCTLAFAALLLAGCGPSVPTASLFPLEPGLRWVCDVKSEWENNTVEHEARVITTEGEVELGGPGPGRAGTAWQHPTTACLLRRRAEFPPEIRHTHPSVPMNYVIEAIDETVEVRAGRYEKCLKVRGQAMLRLFADPVVGWKDMPLTTTEWYCHGPGVVKLVREEPAGSTFLTGGTMTLELIEWK